MCEARAHPCRPNKASTGVKSKGTSAKRRSPKARTRKRDVRSTSAPPPQQSLTRCQVERVGAQDVRQGAVSRQPSAPIVLNTQTLPPTRTTPQPRPGAEGARPASPPGPFQDPPGPTKNQPNPAETETNEQADQVSESSKQIKKADQESRSTNVNAMTLQASTMSATPTHSLGW